MNWSQSDVDKLYRRRAGEQIEAVVQSAKAKTRSKHGKRADLGNKGYRSSWEANIARYLNWLQSMGAILYWEYETEDFEFRSVSRGVRFYRIDFKLYYSYGPGDCAYWEVKGWLRDEDKTRLKRMKQFYPQVRIELIDRTAYQAIARQCRHVLPYWEN